MKFLGLIPACLVLAACVTVPPVNTSAEPARETSVLAFAQAACGDCHAVETGALSPNQDAPEWPRIVNQSGLTSATLESWLVDAHNYPEEMDFDLDVPQVDELVAYMMTLKVSDYQPPIQ